MSRSTPRKSRHRQQLSGAALGPRAINASDYESDTAYYTESRDMPPASQVPPRTNTELNLSVLQRYQPSIRAIVSIAANAVVYVFRPATQNWDKSGVEGTLFVCEQEPVVVAGQVLPRACVFVLNRKGLENATVDLAKVTDCEVTGELLIFKIEDTSVSSSGAEEGGGDAKVVGLWIHADQDDTQQVNSAIIQESWRRLRETVDSATAAAESQESVGPAVEATGRKLSINYLFGRSTGNGDEDDRTL